MENHHQVNHHFLSSNKMSHGFQFSGTDHQRVNLHFSGWNHMKPPVFMANPSMKSLLGCRPRLRSPISSAARWQRTSPGAARQRPWKRWRRHGPGVHRKTSPWCGKHGKTDGESSIWMGFSIINPSFWGLPIYGNPHMTKTKGFHPWIVNVSGDSNHQYENILVGKPMINSKISSNAWQRTPTGDLTYVPWSICVVYFPTKPGIVMDSHG